MNEHGFGLAEIKVEGRMKIDPEYIEDGYPLPKLPSKHICTSVDLAGKILDRKGYTFELIKSQPYFRK